MARAVVLLMAIAQASVSGCHTSLTVPPGVDRGSRPDVIVIGAGISGLAAAIEAAQHGATVIVIEASTVPGGHAVLATGVVSIVDTPLQRNRRISDSAKLAEKDFFARGEDANPEWVHAYVRDSKEWLYDWLTALGVDWETVIRAEGNSVPRLHRPRNKGMGLVEPLLRQAYRDPRITFLWATRADELIVADNEARGVRVTNLRTGGTHELSGGTVIVATGGFQSNLERVLANWPSELPRPMRLLLGAAHSATGGGHEMIARVGGTVGQLDHQWNYVLGFPDPRDPKGLRGLAAFNLNSIWVNRDGRRFTREYGDEKASLRALLQQPDGRYWAIFDEKSKNDFSITLAGWENFEEVRKVTFESGLILSAATLEALAIQIGANPSVLRSTIDRFNGFIDRQRDEDFGRFNGPSSDIPPKIDSAPFYAAPFFPITRKSMGGIRVDRGTRVLNASGVAMRNLFAVGEVTGFAGINGKAALEGTFLGPSMYMGRIAGRAAVTEGEFSQRQAEEPALRELPATPAGGSFDDQQCISCHDVRRDVGLNRPAFWHFEQSHAKVLARRYTCTECHSDLAPYRADEHALNRPALIKQCVTCHGVQRSGAPRLD